MMLQLIAVIAFVGQLAHSQTQCGQTPIPPTLTTLKAFEHIVGGTVATPYSWPWQVVFCQVTAQGGCSLICGGSVVDNNWVVTAGHCVYGNTGRPQRYGVRVGVFDQSNSQDGTHINITRIHLHPSYRPNPVPQWDIALLELATPIVYGTHVQPVCLPAQDADMVVEPMKAWVTGWGTTSEGGQISRQLKQVQVPYVNYGTCHQEYGNDIHNNTMICAGIAGSDTCQGDSGGPCVGQKSNSWYLYGLTSWGQGCAEAGHAGVYSRVSAYCPFIASTTGNKVQCQ